MRRVLPERAGRRAPVDGGERRSALRALSTHMAGARSAASAGGAAAIRNAMRNDRQPGRSSMKRILQGITIVVLVLLPALTASAQVDRATLIGTVHDTSGGVMPGAAVVARNVATNVPFEAVTDSPGHYMIGAL